MFPVEYWLDSNSMIEAKKHGYAFDLMPGYWSLIGEKLQDGTLGVPYRVYYEIVHKPNRPDGTKDDVAQWLMDRERLVQAREPDTSIQQCYQEIAAYVNANGLWSLTKRTEFLDGADGWVIAYAKARGGKVVTLEHADPNKPKIPNVCTHFRLPCMTPWEMLREQGFSFELVRPK